MFPKSLLLMLSVIGTLAEPPSGRGDSTPTDTSSRAGVNKDDIDPKLTNLSNVSDNHLTLGKEGNVTNNELGIDVQSCFYPFSPVGEGCYYFSEEKRNYHGALQYCESLSHSDTHVTLAVLDYGEEEDEAVMNEAVSKGVNFWVGGSTIDGVQWLWEDGRVVDLQAPFWHADEPNEPDNKCAVAEITTFGNNIRSYLYDSSCDEHLNFVCQTGCPFEYRRIGAFCYFLSEESGLDYVTWTDARDYCQSMSVPSGYHSDLAVLGRVDQDSYHLMDTLAAAYDYTHTWLGGYAPTDCAYQWVDGRPLELSSHYWHYSDPSCGSHNRVSLYHNTNTNRTYLVDSPDGSSFPFICQLFLN